MLFSLKKRAFAGQVLLFLSTALAAQLCYGQVTREDVVTYSLDYYQLKHRKQEAVKQALEEKKAQKVKREAEITKEEAEKTPGWIKQFLKEYVYPNLHFTATIEEEYNDNIYKTHSDKSAGFVTNFNTSLILDLNLGLKKLVKGFESPGGHTYFTFGFKGPEVDLGTGVGTNVEQKKDLYEPSFSTYAILDYQRGKYGATLSYEPQRKYFNLVDISSAATERDKGRVYYWSHDYKAEARADWNKFPTKLAYHHKGTSYPSGYKTSENITDTITLLTKYKLSYWTGIVLDYAIQDVTYDNRADQDWTSTKFSAGLDGRLFKRLSFYAKFGQQELDRDNRQNKTFNQLNCGLKYIPKPGAAIVPDLSFSQDIRTSTYANEEYSENQTIKLELNFFPNFNPRLVFDTGLSFINRDYSSGRSDEIKKYYLKADYKYKKWLELYLKYEYAERKSSSKAFSYTNNILTSGLKLFF